MSIARETGTVGVNTGTAVDVYRVDARRLASFVSKNLFLSSDWFVVITPDSWSGLDSDLPVESTYCAYTLHRAWFQEYPVTVHYTSFRVPLQEFRSVLSAASVGEVVIQVRLDTLLIRVCESNQVLKIQQIGKKLEVDSLPQTVNGLGSLQLKDFTRAIKSAQSVSGYLTVSVEDEGLLVRATSSTRMTQFSVLVPWVTGKSPTGGTRGNVTLDSRKFMTRILRTLSLQEITVATPHGQVLEIRHSSPAMTLRFLLLELD